LFMNVVISLFKKVAFKGLWCALNPEVATIGNHCM
jgi:hypothetical protein